MYAHHRPDRAPLRLLLAALIVLAVACNAGPQPIVWGFDACARCRMILRDRAFGAEFVERGGRVHKFDGLDELVRFLGEQPAAGRSYVTNGVDGGLVPAETAVYLRSSAIRTPMGGDIMSFASRDAGERFVARQKLRDGAWLDYVTAMVATQHEEKRKRRGQGQHEGHDHH